MGFNKYSNSAQVQIVPHGSKELGHCFYYDSASLKSGERRGRR